MNRTKMPDFCAKKSNNYNLTNKVCTERKERDKIEKNKWNNNAMF